MPPVNDIRLLSLDEITTAVGDSGEPSFRAAQIWEWIWKKGARSFDAMSNLPSILREKLSRDYDFRIASPELTQKSSDGTIKILFRLSDGCGVEGVLIPSGQRTTACISTQTGCRLGCLFCATGQVKEVRNLSPGEIFDQYQILREYSLQHFNLALTNLVIMGMGEPLLNFDSVIRAVKHITDPQGSNFSPQRITLSTAGLTDQIRKLADTGLRLQLALSLHAANDLLRSQLMPVNKTHDLNSLIKALRYYCQRAHRRVTLEYLLLRDINDGPEHAHELAVFARKFPSRINLIHYNATPGSPFLSASEEKTAFFLSYLEKQGLVVHIRRSRGTDIEAACGQLAGKKSN
jgi:23S rRNA (adenine2503-C2)-methyltransferase